eukprot:3220364-Prorocentrum_lima.AAC.1
MGQLQKLCHPVLAIYQQNVQIPHLVDDLGCSIPPDGIVMHAVVNHAVGSHLEQHSRVPPCGP